MSLETVSVDLPEDGRFSAALLARACDRFEGRHVAAVLVLGDTPAAFTVSMAARHSGVAVLRAGGNGGLVPGFGSLVSGRFWGWWELERRVLVLF